MAYRLKNIPPSVENAWQVADTVRASYAYMGDSNPIKVDDGYVDEIHENLKIADDESYERRSALAYMGVFDGDSIVGVSKAGNAYRGDLGPFGVLPGKLALLSAEVQVRLTKPYAIHDFAIRPDTDFEEAGDKLMMGVLEDAPDRTTIYSAVHVGNTALRELMINRGGFTTTKRHGELNIQSVPLAHELLKLRHIK